MRRTIRVIGIGMGLMGVLALGPRAAQAQAAADTTAHAAADTTGAEPKEVELLHAGELLKETPEALELIGDVRLRQGDTGLRADRATEYADRDEYLFLGDVRIIERGDTLRAERVRYNKRTKVGYALGKVRLSDGEVVVYAPSGRYHTEEKRAVFEDGVTLVDSATVLTSRAGEYWSDDKRAEFYGDVHLSGDRTYLESDSVTYFRETEVAVARGNVFIERLGGEDDDTAASDSTTRTFLFGQSAYNDNRAAVSRIRGRPLLIQLRADATGAPSDTLLIRAGRLDVIRQDSLQRLIALDSVKIWQRDFAAVADSVVYDRLRREGRPAREESRLFRDPTAWFQRAQAHGDTLRVTARESSIDSLFIVGNAFVAQRDTVLDRLSQLRGRYMLGLFVNDSLRTLFVRPNAEAIYFLRDEETDALKGAVRASADRVVFDLQGEGELKDIRFYRGVEGEYYDVGLIPEPLRLDGFRWEPERRPEKVRLLPPDVLERLTAWTDRFRAAASRVPVPGVTGVEERNPPPDH